MAKVTLSGGYRGGEVVDIDDPQIGMEFTVGTHKFRITTLEHPAREATEDDPAQEAELTIATYIGRV